MKSVSACCAAVLLVAFALPVHADPTPEQKNQIENCKVLSGAVFQFAEARDRKQSRKDAFKTVTHGQAYVPGSLLDETLQWAYAHPDEQPDTASGHYYDRCVLDAYEALNPDSEGELGIASAACQQGHPGAPDAIRSCIDDKAQDIIAQASAPQTAVAAASTAAPAAATVAVATPVVTAAVPAPAPATVAAAAAPAPQPAPMVSLPVPLPAASTAATPAEVAASQSVASTPVQSVNAPAAPLPRTEVTAVAPAVSAPEPVVADAQAPQSPPQAVAPVAAPPVVIPPPLPAPAAPKPALSQPLPAAPAPVIAQVPAPAPVVAKAPAPQPAVAVVSTPLPPTPAHAAATNPPPNLTGFGKLTVGMSMEDAYKALESHGDTDYDDQGEVHTYMIGQDHGFMELRPSATGTLYSIRVVGGADAHQAPVMGVTLGDAAFILVNNVGLPSSRAPLPGDKELWTYRDRNYSWEISPGGDVIGFRIIDTNYDPNAASQNP